MAAVRAGAEVVGALDADEVVAEVAGGSLSHAASGSRRRVRATGTGVRGIRRASPGIAILSRRARPDCG